MKQILVCLVISLSVVNGRAESPWSLPLDLNDTNTSINFEVDSTWHLVKGATKDIHGRAWLENKADFKSIKAEVLIPVASFDTDNRSRDKRMREVMHADLYPEVKFLIDKVNEPCNPVNLDLGKVCQITIDGSLSISNTLRHITFPAQIVRTEMGYAVNGRTELKWAEYGVEDPSILIAKLKPNVFINFTVNLNTANLTLEPQNAKPA